MSTGFKSIKVVEFDGIEEETFREWRSKSEAIGYANGWWDQFEDDTKDVLTISKTTKDPVEILKLTNEKSSKMYFTLACTKNSFEYVVDADTEYQMYRNLVEKYESVEENEYLKLTAQFMR